MNFTSSPSVSSSTFPTPKGSVFGCLSFVLRRFLCSRTLPTYPFDHLKEIDPFGDQTQNSMKSHESDFPAPPNLVARLMGLDSMPDKITEKGLTPITRSKSMNSVDYRFQKTGEMQGNHTRMKTSVSFRETPSYFELEDHDFFVLRFENGERNNKFRAKKARPENQQRRRRRRKTERSRIPKEEGRRHGFKIEEEDDDFEVFVRRMEKFEEKGRNRKKKKEECLVDGKVETESESENFSPVSVLDHSLFVGDHESLTSVEEETRSRSSSPRRKLGSKLSNFDRPSYNHNNETCSKGDHNQEPSEAIQGRKDGLHRKDYHKHQNIKMLNQICRLAASEMEDSDWVCKGGLVRNLNKWEVEIGVELGLQIVEQMMDEVVQQLFFVGDLTKFEF